MLPLLHRLESPRMLLCLASMELRQLVHEIVRLGSILAQLGGSLL